MKIPLPRPAGGRVLKDWVSASLREAILNGHFEPGEKLDQELIAEELVVSRTPVREAMMVLESEGFVEVRPRRGAFIVTLSRRDIRDICQIRGLLEAEAVRQATPLIPEAELDEVETALRCAQARVKTGDVATLFESDLHFHETVLDCAENRLLQEMLGGLTNRISRLRQFAQLGQGQHLAESYREHLAILEAMRCRDAEAAGEAMTVHLQNSSNRLQGLVTWEAQELEEAN